MTNIKNFYPTPPNLIAKMVAKIKGHPKKALEPSAGKGDLIDGVCSSYRFGNYDRPEFSAIEVNPDLQALLRGKGVKMLDTDFLSYSGPDKFDLIIANPPFDEGDKHLLKAIEIAYRCEIVFLLSAETIRNPFSSSRKLLAKKLADLGASIEFIQNAFIVAERPTPVEVALIHIAIDNKVEDDLFAGIHDSSQKAETFAENYEVSTGNTIFDLVSDYNNVIQIGQETILAYFRNYRKIGSYLSLNQCVGGDKQSSYSTGDLTDKMQKTLNTLLTDVRVEFWRKTLNLKEVQSRLTRKKQAEFEHLLADRCKMDFTEGNVRQFVLNLIGSYEQTLTEAVVEQFNRFTVTHCWNKDNPVEANIHYFSGWATNDAFKVAPRIVVPIGYRGSYDGPFTGYQGRWELNHSAADALRDIDLVMNYFEGHAEYTSISDALREAFARGENSTESTFFSKIIAHKKGTIHLTFRSAETLRRFNTVACKGKAWLPCDYGSKAYSQMTGDEKAVVDSFEGEKTYSKSINKPLFAVTGPSFLRLAAATADEASFQYDEAA